MKVTSTQFRKEFFQVVERALQGELIQIVYKGRVIHLVLDDRPSKLSMLIPRDTICGTLDDFEKAQRNLDSEMSAI